MSVSAKSGCSLHLATECNNKSHSAAFPKELPSWFIKLFTKEGDLVLDPFVGSGTTCVVATELSREYIGIEIKSDYYDLAIAEVNVVNHNATQLRLL